LSIQLMQYLDTTPQAQSQQLGARKYYGSVAEGYDAKREESPKWRAENALVAEYLDGLMAGSWILDVPCGTGRFFQLYHDKGFIFRGMDASADMLRIAASKVVDPEKARFIHGDITKGTGLYDKSVDAALMIRLTRWLSPEDCQKALIELQRVARKKIIWTARVANHPHMRPVELFEEVLDGWKITRNESANEPEYRVIMAEPV